MALSIQRLQLEKLLDKIADALIESEVIDPTRVLENQKFIRDGVIKFGATANTAESMALYQKDIEANIEDIGFDINNLNNSDDSTGAISELIRIAMSITDFDSLSVEVLGGINDSISVSLNGGGLPPGTEGQEISNLIFKQQPDGTIVNPLNVSQFIPLQQASSIVDTIKAEEYLDTNIFELLPTADTRQARIIRFFQELNALLPTTPPSFMEPIIRDGNNDWVGLENYSKENSISYAQDNPNSGGIDEEDAFIHRLKQQSINNSDSLANPNDTNSTITIEDIYNTIEPYLRDILEDPIVPLDERDEYENESSGYLQFRNPNQGIIIRNTQSPFIDEINSNTKNYLTTGFTTTMWTKFLDKTSEGTLFNFGNPHRMNTTAFGFSLETYVIKGNEKPTTNNLAGQTEGNYIERYGFTTDLQGTWRQIFRDGSSPNNTFDGLITDGDYSGEHQVPNEGFFSDTDTERFVRLVVRETDGKLRGSHIGMPFMARRQGVPEFGYGEDFHTAQTEDLNDPYGTIPYDNALGLMSNTHIPYNPNEWYFICATYNPTVEEDESHEDVDNSNTNIVNNLSMDKDFWRNHIEIINDGDVVQTNYTYFSNQGSRCKVEIISRSDLLRARGFKV